MRKRWAVLGLCVVAVGLALLRAVPRHVWLTRCRARVESAVGHQGAAWLPPTRPDYDGATVPPNIAPLNFRVLTPGQVYYARAEGGRPGRPVEVLSRSPDIRFPRRAWRRLLRASRGQDVLVRVCVVSRDGGYDTYGPMTLRVAQEPIDPYLVNRIIPPLYNYWGGIEIRQRSLESFRERTVVHNRMAANACLNCHSFRANRADRMTLGVRSGRVGTSTVMVQNGQVEKIKTSFGYTAWHPSGLLAAYSVNDVHQFFHRTGHEVRDVVDLDSGLAYYDLRTQTAKTAPGLNDEDRLETYPTWTPDGKWLYFSSAAFPWEGRRRVPPDNYRECRYDLCRVRYDITTDQWGKPETVLAASAMGKSLLLPRISPDGRFLVFCACNYGCFPIYQPSSDLYLLDLGSGTHRRLDALNSPRSESWHSWSSNGRWVAFSSKRRDGLFTRTYLSYVDASGQVGKPFIVPQQDPERYDSCLSTYTVPELVAEPVPVRPQRLAEAVTSPIGAKVTSPISFGSKAASTTGAPGAQKQSGPP